MISFYKFYRIETREANFYRLKHQLINIAMATQVVDVAVQSLGKMKGNIASGMDDILSVVGNLAEGEGKVFITLLTC